MLKIWNREQTAYWLAGVLLEKHCDHAFDCISPDKKGCNISAEDPRGDPIRARIAIGWSVLWHLADLAFAAESENWVDPTDVSIDAGAGLEVSAATELAIRKAWVQYAESLGRLERLEYRRLQNWLFPAIFQTPKPYPRTWVNLDVKPISMLYNLALCWACTHEGPSFFKEAWSSADGNRKCIERITAAWNAKPAVLQEMCIQTATDLGWAFEGKDNEERLSFEFDSMDDYRDLVHENEKHTEVMVGSFRDIPVQIVPMQLDTSKVAPFFPGLDDDDASSCSTCSS